jgi:hypothetical protein
MTVTTPHVTRIVSLTATTAVLLCGTIVPPASGWFVGAKVTCAACNPAAVATATAA